MIRSNYVQVTRAKATLVCRVYHRGVSPDLGWVIQVFRYKNVSPISLQNCITKVKRAELDLLVYRMYDQCDTKLFASTVHYCSLLKCITKEKKLAKLWNFVSSWNCGCEPKTIGTGTAWLFTITYHQCDTISFMSMVICHSLLKRITENNEMARNSKVFTKKPVFG